jgi:hypothetical protein
MFEVELRSSIVTSKNLIVVQNNSVNLMGTVKLGTFVLVDDKRQVG